MARRPKVIPKGVKGKIVSHVHSVLKRESRPEEGLLPGIDDRILQAVGEAYRIQGTKPPTTTRQAIEKLLTHGDIKRGRTRDRALVGIRHPEDGKRVVALGHYSWSPSGRLTGVPEDFTVLYGVSNLLGIELRCGPPKGFLPGFEPSVEEIQGRFDRAYLEDQKRRRKS